MAERRGIGGRGRFVRIALVVLVAVAGCAPVIRGHGFAPKPEDLAKIAPGIDTEATVREKVGRPGSTGLINKNAWYYVASTIENYTYHEPRVIDRTVVAVLFSDQGVVSAVHQYGIADGKVIDLVTRTTPTYGKELTVVQQLLGNILNFGGNGLIP
jgi:outer membrane protein assembly factor BamE (lipoprotein component of BamABCDE complex)